MCEQREGDKITAKFYMSYAITEVLESGIPYTNRKVIEYSKEYSTLEEANEVKEEIMESVKKAFDVKRGGPNNGC